MASTTVLICTTVERTMTGTSGRSWVRRSRTCRPLMPGSSRSRSTAAGPPVPGSCSRASSPVEAHATSYPREASRTDRYFRMLSSSSTTIRVGLVTGTPSVQPGYRRHPEDGTGRPRGEWPEGGGGHGTVGSPQGDPRGGSGGRGPLVQQAMVDGEECQLEAVRGPHLVEDVAQVVLHRLLAQGELLGDLLVAEAGHHGRRDLQLPGGEAEAPG